MNLAFYTRNIFKFGAIVLTMFVAVVGYIGMDNELTKVKASASGPTPGHTAAPGESSCIACHSGSPANSGKGKFFISGIPANYRAGEQIPVTVTINEGDAVTFGFQFTAIDSLGRKVGTFQLPSGFPEQMQEMTGFINSNERRYISHTTDGVTPTVFGTKSWTFNWTAPSQRVGKVSFYAAGNAANSDGSTSGDHIYTTAASTLSGTAISNFDTDEKTDVAVYRPSTNVWYALNSTDDGFQAVQFGSPGDIIAPGDFDGDGITDRAVFRPSNGVWYIAKSTGGFSSIQFGMTGDIPVSGDYDGDLKTDIAVWRPSTGVWYILRSSDQTYDFRSFGLSSDKPVQGDYDSDGVTDIAVWRPSTGVWYIFRSSDFSYSIFGFGSTGDHPVQGDYDGDGKHDAAVFRPSDRTWYVLGSTEGFSAVQFGLSNDLAVPGDFDGDGKTDRAVFRDGVWYILRSSDLGLSAYTFGQTGDIPIQNALLPN